MAGLVQGPTYVMWIWCGKLHAPSKVPTEYCSSTQWIKSLLMSASFSMDVSAMLNVVVRPHCLAHGQEFHCLVSFPNNLAVPWRTLEVNMACTNLLAPNN